MKVKKQITTIVVSTACALVAVNANSAGGPGYSAYSGYNYQQQGQQQWYGQSAEQGYKQPAQQQPEIADDSGAADAPSLPDGWSEHFDPNSGQYYYYNSVNGVTTWDKPTSDPPEPPIDESKEIVEPSSQEVKSEDGEAETMTEHENGGANVYGQTSWGSSQDPMLQQVDSQPSQQRLSPTDSTSVQQGQDVPKEADNGGSPQQPGWGFPKDQMIPQANQQASGWGDQNVEKIPERTNFNAETMDEQKKEPEVSGWGMPKEVDQQPLPGPNPQQTTQQPSGWVNQNQGQAQSSSGWGVPKGSEPSKGPEPSTTGWGVPKVSEPTKEPERPQQVAGWGAPRDQRPSEDSHPPLGSPGSSTEQASGRPQMQQPPSGQTGPPRQLQQNPGTSQGPGQNRPGPGQIPIQNQRPNYGQNNPYGQPPVQRYSQYQQYGNPNQYGQYGSQQQPYGQYQQQQSVAQAGKSFIEDSSATIQDALGKSWQSILGFGSQTKEAMGQVRDQVVSGANVAGQTLSEKSTSK